MARLLQAHSAPAEAAVDSKAMAMSTQLTLTLAWAVQGPPALTSSATLPFRLHRAHNSQPIIPAEIDSCCLLQLIIPT